MRSNTDTHHRKTLITCFFCFSCVEMHNNHLICPNCKASTLKSIDDEPKETLVHNK